MIFSESVTALKTNPSTIIVVDGFFMWGFLRRPGCSCFGLEPFVLSGRGCLTCFRPDCSSRFNLFPPPFRPCTLRFVKLLVLPLPGLRRLQNSRSLSVRKVAPPRFEETAEFTTPSRFVESKDLFLSPFAEIAEFAVPSGLRGCPSLWFAEIAEFTTPPSLRRLRNSPPPPLGYLKKIEEISL